ncbi:hypothetical protein CU669_01095 [Paramagnetospirillum kuznetsovii]|uniref:Leucine-binding protein domain-containing protein n=1 Tax=Paramagnetospirillum kuznetsovii TaxID=2053833 RepID=A0A364P301_9PROT|nr:ABC transporter substrate-binding protein [Paramagnetospirillum kuznetsovii]RAU23729.1 hypothetical protein CU669_01095 [Paramagnetospirillum kuznetsovii]
MTVAVGACPDAVAADTLTIAVAAPMSGGGKHIGPEIANAVQLLADETNAVGGIGGRLLTVRLFDDATSADVAKTIAAEISAGPALAVIGHAHSPVALAAAPIYRDGGLATLSSAAEGALTKDFATFFRIIPALDAQGRAAAIYALEELGQTRTTIVYRDDNFGRSLLHAYSDQFTKGGRGRVRAMPLPKGPVDWAAVVTDLAADPGLIVIAMQDFDAKHFLAEKRRRGNEAPVLGSQAFARDVFITLFKDEPEEAARPGYFAEGLYAMAPTILDTANKDTLDFALAYRARFGASPGWIGVKYYEAARAVVQALGRAAIGNTAQSRDKDRASVRQALAAMDSPSTAVGGLTGPILFDAERNRVDSFRVGRFQGGRFLSAPVQLVPVADPRSVDLPRAMAADTVRKIGQEHFWRQRIVYTGIQPVSIDKIETKDGFFSADFYMWMRFVEREGITAVQFPDMIRGGYNPAQPVASRKADGMTYLLYRVKGDFRNEFNLADYPFDQQQLIIRLANTHLTREEVVYAVDALPSGRADAGSWRMPGQWDGRQVDRFRDDLVSKGALGDLDAMQSGRALEFSGFKAVLMAQRQVMVFLRKNLLPLGLLTLVVYSTLFYPESMLKERLTVPVAAMLAASVLLSGVQARLGDIGYTTAAEVIFYIFFFAGLMAMLSALVEERLRLSNWPRLMIIVRRGSHILFPLTVLATWMALFVQYRDRF